MLIVNFLNHASTITASDLLALEGLPNQGNQDFCQNFPHPHTFHVLGTSSNFESEWLKAPGFARTQIKLASSIQISKIQAPD